MTGLLSVQEVARLLHLHEMTVRRYIRQGRLKAVKVGGRVRVRPEDLELFMKPIDREKQASCIAIPSLVKPTAAELTRRRALAKEVLRLRDEMGPIDITADELVRLGRGESTLDDRA